MTPFFFEKKQSGTGEGRGKGHICSSPARPCSGENIGEMGQYVYRGGASFKPKVNHPRMGALRALDFGETFSVNL